MHQDCNCEWCVIERAFVQSKKRHDNLAVCATWMERDGFQAEAELLRRIASREPMANLWAVVYVNKTLEGHDQLQVFLIESKGEPLRDEAAQKVLGRSLEEGELFIMRGPFLWPDSEAFDGVIAQVDYDEAT